MKPDEKIDFQNVGELTRRLTAQKITPPRFSIEITEREAANGIYSAMRAEVANRRNSLIFDDDTRRHIEQAARWLVNPDGKSGLMLMGLCGNGKTTMMRSLARLIEYVTEATVGYSKRSVVTMLSAKEIARMCAAADKERKEFKELFSVEMLGIDDLGEEPKEVLSYGMVYTPLIDIIGERYDRQLTTIITTNLTKEQLSEKYGVRIYDRFKETLEIVTFKNPSYRI